MVLGKANRIKNILYSFSVLNIIVVLGTLGFKLLDDRYSILEAFYMTVITITTVGFRELHDPTEGMMIFTSLLIISSFGTFAYVLTAISAYVIDGEFQQYFKEIKVKSEVSKIKNHVIVCGYGRNGSQAVSVLKAHKQPFVLIESQIEVIEELKKTDPTILFVHGDATHDDVLEKARIDNAKALIATLPSDSNNLFVVLTARERNKTIKIISRASEENTDHKLRIAGANNVIMPDKIGGAHMASLVMKPDVIEFLDFVSANGQIDINLEEIDFNELPEGMKNRTIHDCGIRNKTGANIIGLKSAEGDFIINPSPETKITSNVKLFALGTPEQINKLKNLFT